MSHNEANPGTARTGVRGFLAKRSQICWVVVRLSISRNEANPGRPGLTADVFLTKRSQSGRVMVRLDVAKRSQSGDGADWQLTFSCETKAIWPSDGQGLYRETKVRPKGADYQWVEVPLQELSV